jgi:hypothetical protein
VTGALTGALSLVTLAAAPAMATSPKVVLAWSDAAFDITGHTSFFNFAAANIPAGTWWVTLTATIDASIDGSVVSSGETTCRLRGGASTALDQATWAFTANAQGRSIASLDLTGLYASPGTWSASIDCRTDAPETILLTDVRVSAVKGVTSGRGKPKLRSTSRDQANVAGDNAFHTVRSLSLPAGRWWITAKTNLVNSSTNETNNPVCSLAIGSDKDQTSQSLYYTTQQGFEGEAGVQVAHSFGSSGSASLRCKGQRAFSVDHVRIVALGAGRLKRVKLGGSSSTSGRGTPIVVTAYRSSSVPIPSGGDFVTVGQVSLPAGKWLIDAKAWLHDGASTPVRCRLVPGGGKGEETHSLGGPAGGSTGLYLQGAVDAGASFVAKLQCFAASNDTSLTYLRITAVSAATLSVDQLLE